MVPDLTLPAVVAGVVGTLCAVIAIAAWRAMLHTGNRGITLVSIAFGVLSAKNFAKSVNLAIRKEEGPGLELLFSLLDLTAVALIAWPLLRHRSA